MGKNKKPIGLFITDNGIAFFSGEIGKSSLAYDQVDLPKSTIENGYIKEPEVLLDHLKKMWSKNKIKPKFVRLAIQDQNVLAREFTIKKKELEKKSIQEYFGQRIGKDFHVPFENYVLSHKKKSEDSEQIKLVLYISDKDLLHDYYDVLEKLGVKDIVFDVAVSALMEVASESYDFDDENIMMVSLYDQLLSIQIIENNQLVFGIIEEREGQVGDFIKKIEISCERVANYFKYNMRNGKKEITQTIIFDLSDEISIDDIHENIIEQIDHLHPNLFKIDDYEDFFAENPNGILMAYASNQIILNREKDEKIIDFNLNRISPLRTYGYYVFVMALSIFALVAIIYIPYKTNREAILQQTYINEALANQKASLQSIIESSETNAYLDAYQYIERQEDLLPINQYEDLLALLPNDISIVDFEFDVENQSITMVISADDTSSGLDYILSIYETYGVIEEDTSSARWMIDMPEENIISQGMIEVVIYYA